MAEETKIDLSSAFKKSAPKIKDGKISAWAQHAEVRRGLRDRIVAMGYMRPQVCIDLVFRKLEESNFESISKNPVDFQLRVMTPDQAAAFDKSTKK